MYKSVLLKLFINLIIFSPCLYSSLPDVKTMTLDQKVGQLFIAAAYSNVDDANLEGLKMPFDKYVDSLIKDYHIGGLILKQHWTLDNEVLKIQEYQSKAAIPLFITQDFEWGLTQRLSNTPRFPQNMTLGAVQDVKLIEAMGHEVGRECRAIGVNYNFSPCVDVNNNPLNPVIHLRSFGDNVAEVCSRGIAMMKGLQRGGVIACAKHFPGHGDTGTDSHLSLPLLPFSQDRIRTLEMEPFRQLVKEGVMSVMVGHLCVPAFEPEKDKPSSLSKKINADLLQGELGFKGLVVTDDLLMKAITNSYDGGEACLQAFLAGNDLILTATTAMEGIHCVKKAVLEGIIPESEIDRRVEKILSAKAWILEHPAPKKIELFTDHALKLKKQLYESALTLVKNDEAVVPLKPNQSDLAVLQVGHQSGPCPFYEEVFNLDRGAPLFIYEEDDLSELQDYQTLVVCFLGMNKFRDKHYGLSIEMLETLKDLSKERKVIAVVFGTPYSLTLIPDVDAIILGYEDDIDAQRGAAKVLFGVLEAKGRLPIKLQ